MATKAKAHRTKSDALFARAQKVMVGGVSSPVRAFKAVGGTPVFISRGKGSHIWSADGDRYVDYVCSWGPLIAGHSHPKVVKAVSSALTLGTSFGAPSENELKLAEKICTLLPSIEKVRFVSSGTEATMSALRLARAYTKRDKVLKFDGCYHGHSDAFLTNAGSGLATLDVPSSAGVPASVATDTVTIPYNDIGALESAFAAHPGEFAAVIVEPVAGNMGVVPPADGFLETARSLCTKDGSLLIFDEVITGFRLSLGGAQAVLEVRPDITCLGKVIGGGFPVGAYEASEAMMRMVAPEGPVYQAGTLSGNPVAMAAGLATISLMEGSGSYRSLDSTSARLERGLLEEAGRVGVDVTTNRVGSMLGLFFSGLDVTNFEEAKRTDRALYARFHRSMLEEGVYLPPSAFETLFVSTTHTRADVDATIRASSRAFAKCSAGGAVTMNSTFLDACNRKEPAHTPVWFMRQAGRYLPSYRAVKGSRPVTEIAKDPALASQVAVDAVRALDVDAAIIFADIMLPLEGMGVPFRIEENVGPIVTNPIRTLDDVNALKALNPEADVGYIFDGIEATVQKLDDTVPLVGFSGAPFTLAGYMIEGRPSRDLELTKKMMYREPETWHRLMSALTKMITTYLACQVSHGVDAVQIFDSWVGCLSPSDYEQYVSEYTSEIMHSLSGRVPRIHFCANSSSLLEEFVQTGPDVLSVDWRIEISKAWEVSNGRVGIQGNLDPVLALAGGQAMRGEVGKILEHSKGRAGHIFSLGHGVLRETEPDSNLRSIVKIVHEKTKRSD